MNATLMFRAVRNVSVSCVMWVSIITVTPSDAGVTKLNAVLTPGGDVSYSSLQFSPDSSRVLYLADQDTDGVGEVYSVPATGGSTLRYLLVEGYLLKAFSSAPMAHACSTELIRIRIMLWNSTTAS